MLASQTDLSAKPWTERHGGWRRTKKSEQRSKQIHAAPCAWFGTCIADLKTYRR